MRIRATLSLTLAVVVLTACGSDYPLGDEQEAAAQRGDTSLQGAVTAAGSSAQGPAMDAWRSGFATLYPRAQVQYSPDGSGAGRGALLAGAVGFAGSDAYLSDEELAESTDACGPGGAFNIPAYVSPISVAFNLPGITELKLDAATVARIFRGEITTWNDPVIAAQNDVDLPALPISAVSRSDDSGTTENFTDYLHAVVPEVWTEEADGTWPAELENENAKGNAGVVSTVASTVGAVTYADDSAVGDPLGRVALKVGEAYVPVSSDAAAAAVDLATRVEGRQDYDIALDLDRTTDDARVYPLVLVSYHVYCARYENEATAAVVRAFGTYAVSADGQAEAAEAAKSSPISEELSRQATDALASIEVGDIP
ncbi:MAG: phosphate transporter substrate-binding protein PstS [Micrococcaceae bacterium]|uniref:Phosphate-binding protein n=1 Tax=Arthrobacter cheniae TaxID=1258888 RepID=A0A3A5M4L5_9MICC|nr:phosphate ABC transporter substrate-binding protein PstS [Arthrobacter cheniae]MCU1634641.1 phosphate transporter substrate-binding protein PstS [Micrococcaceae bacterium]RJT80159.1 phosphate ABC transporter substrate-binding protein PstS [Arthrobacter cheniae]